MELNACSFILAILLTWTVPSITVSIFIVLIGTQFLGGWFFTGGIIKIIFSGLNLINKEK